MVCCYKIIFILHYMRPVTLAQTFEVGLGCLVDLALLVNEMSAEAASVVPAYIGRDSQISFTEILQSVDITVTIQCDCKCHLVSDNNEHIYMFFFFFCVCVCVCGGGGGVGEWRGVG